MDGWVVLVDRSPEEDYRRKVGTVREKHEKRGGSTVKDIQNRDQTKYVFVRSTPSSSGTRAADQRPLLDCAVGDVSSVSAGVVR